jgi:protein tyrosine phosphatase (PTP) superfamily phosphohydrolase (DUF442 family)
MHVGIPLRVSSLARAVLVAGGLLTGSVASYCGVVLYTGNFHTVDAGRFYRSAQLSRDELAKQVRANGIKSIVNLRGAHPGQLWYEDEIAVSRAAGVVHYDYPLSAHRALTPVQTRDIVEILRTAQMPILVHCQSGADRSGLVAALYQSAIRHQPPREAARELSLWYGHFPFLWSGTKAMDETFQMFVRNAVQVERATSRDSSIVPSLAQLADAAENLYDAVKADNWAGAGAAFRSMQRVANMLPADLLDSSRLRAALDVLRDVLAARNRVGTLSGSNEITLIAANMSAEYKQPVPVGVARLDYWGRELEIQAASRDAMKLAEISRRVRATWDDLRPALEARGSIAAAARFDRLVVQLQTLKSPDAYARFAVPFLDAVDVLEKAFTR